MSALCPQGRQRNYKHVEAWRSPLGSFKGPTLYFNEGEKGERLAFPFRMADGRDGEQVILPTAPGVSNEGGSSELLALAPAVSWPWVPSCGSLGPCRRGGENAQKTGEKTGEIRPQKCERKGANQGSTGSFSPWILAG